MNTGFLVIEGTCCAGKTSLLNSLRDDGFFVIPETNKMGIQFPPPPTNYNEARRNEKLILGLETQRSEMGRKAASSLRFADRLLPSVIAISLGYSIHRGYNTIDGLFEDILEYLHRNTNVFTCDTFVYLKVSYNTVKKRNAGLEKPLDEFWVGQETIETQIKFYELYEQIMQSHNWITIEADQKSKTEIKNEILNLRIKSKPISVEQQISQFQELWDACRRL